MSLAPDARRAMLASTLAYLAITALMGRVVIAALGTSIASDPGDSLLTTAILAWNATHVPWTNAWYQFPIFHPTPEALTLSEHLLGVSVIAAPLQWLTGNSVLAYNTTVLLSYPLCAIAMFALVWRLTNHAPAAFLAGLAYGFAPYRVTHLTHIQVLISFWMPVALLGLHAYLDTHRWRWLALFAMAWVLQGAANGYFLVYFTLVVGLWVGWFLAARGRWRDVAAVAITIVIGLLPLAPILYRYIAAQRALGVSRGIGEISFYSADIAAVLCASVRLRFWGWLRVECAAEGELFPGAALIVLCLVGAVWARRARVTVAADVGGSPDRPGLARRFHAFVRGGSTRGFYLLCAALCWVLSWGPFPRFFGETVLYYAPYAWLLPLPGIGALRVPARLWMMVVLCLTVFMGIVIARLLAGRTSRTLRIVVAAAACGLIADGYTTIPTAGVPRLAATGLHGRTVVFLPVGEVYQDIAAGYHSVEHEFRTINGYSGYQPPHYEALRALSAAADERLFAPFVSRGDVHVVVGGEEAALRAMVERQPGVQLVSDGKKRHYRVPSRGAPAPRPTPAGVRRRLAGVNSPCAPQRLAVLLTDGDLQTRWGCGIQSRDQSLTLDLGAPSQVGGIVQMFGSAGGDFPRRLRVETSMDAESWATVWDGSPAAAVLQAAMALPRDIRLVTEFPARAARYVRLQQLGRDAAYPWSIAELEVWSGS